MARRRKPNRAIQERAGELAAEKRAEGTGAPSGAVQRRQEARQREVEGPTPGFVATETGRAVATGATAALDESVETIAETVRTKEGQEAAAIGALEGRGILMPTEEEARGVTEGAGTSEVPVEVNWLRDGFGVKAPTTAAGEMGAGLVQLVVGAALWGGVAKGARAAFGGRAAAKAVGEAAQPTTVARGAAKGAVEGQVAFGLSDFAAFDADEKRMLVVMNEMPALARFIPDFLAAEDPDDPVWEKRFYRLAEGIGIGGLAGGVLGGAWTAIRRHGAARRAGRPGDVMDHPRKEQIREQQEVAAVTEQVRIEEQLKMADAVQTGRAAVETPPVRGDEGLVGDDAWARIRAMEEQLPEGEVRLDLEEGAPVSQLTEAEVWAKIKEAGDVGEEADEGLDVGVVGEGVETVAAARPARRVLAPSWVVDLSPGGYRPKDAPKIEVALDGLDAPTLSGLTRELVLPEGVRETLALVERTAVARLREAEMAPGDVVRAGRADEAMLAWRESFSEAIGAAREVELEPGRKWKPPPLRMLEDEQARVGWEQAQRIAFRDEGLVHPDLVEGAQPRTFLDENGIERKVYATERAVKVSDMQALRAPDFGSAPGDLLLEAQRPEMMDTILLGERDRAVLGTSREAAAERPLDVSFTAVESFEDLAGLAADIRTKHPRGERAKEMTPEEQARIEEASGKKRDLLRQQARDTSSELDALHEQLGKARQAKDEKRVVRIEEELRKKGEFMDDVVRSITKESASIEQRPDTRSANRVLTDLMVRTGWGAGLRARRADLDPNDALHLIEAAGGSLQRLARAASSDGASGAQRAEAIRGMHKAEAVLHWTKGNDRAAKAAMKRSELPVEQQFLDSMDSRIARRLTDNRLISKSGGTMRVQARLAGIGLAKDVGEVMTQLNAWSRDAGVAWGFMRKARLNNIGRTAMMVRLGGILSRPGTTTAGALGNTAMAVLEIPERFLANVLTAVGDPNVSAKQAFSEAVKQSNDQMVGMVEGMGDGLRLTRDHLAIELRGEAAGARAKERMDRQGNRVMYTEMIKADRFENANDRTVAGVRRDLHIRAGPDEQLAAAAEVVGGVARSVLTHNVAVQQAVDLFFKSANHSAEIRRIAGVKARQWAREMKESGQPEPSAGEIAERAAFLRVNPTDDMLQQANRHAHVNTFTADAPAPVEWYVGAMRRWPVFRHLTSIVKTPANVITEGAKRLPFANKYIRTEREAWAKGGIAAREVAGRQLMGTAMYGAILPLVLNDRLTGGWPEDPQEQAAWRALGKKPYSVKLPGTDTWFNYTYPLGPHALWLAIGANTIRLASAWDSDDATVPDLEAVLSWTRGLLGYMSDETFMGDMIEWLDLVKGDQSPDQTLEVLGRWAEGYTPLGALQRSVMREFVDDGVLIDYERSGGLGGSAETLSEKIREAVDTTSLKIFDLITTGGASNVFPKLDHQGRELQLKNTGGSFQSWLTPTRYTVESTDLLDVAEHEVEFNPPRWDMTFDVRHPVPAVAQRWDLPTMTLEPTPKERHKMSQQAGALYRKDALAYRRSFGWENNTPAGRRRDLETLLSNARRRVRRSAQRDPKNYPDLYRSAIEIREKLTAMGHEELAKERRRRTELR